ncbi:hypothetical protein Tco_0179685 [Tanacetum coccineum]
MYLSDGKFRGLESVSIRRIQGFGYGILEFLGVGTTFDIFQNIHILYFQYGVFVNHDGKWIKTEEEHNLEEIWVVSIFPRQEPVEPLECKASENWLKPSITEPTKLELKELPKHLEYAFLQGDDQLSVVISSALSIHKKTKLLEFEEEITETITEPTMEEYMMKTREDYGTRLARPKFDKDTRFELKGRFLKELHEHTFSGSENEDANEHIERVLEIVDLFTTLDVTHDQLMLRIFPITLTGAASRWLMNEPAGSITTWEILKGKFLNKYCPASRTGEKDGRNQ